MRLGELADRLGCRLDGDPEIEIVRVAGLDQAGEGDVTFLANARFTNAMRATRASAVVLGDDAPAAPCAMLRTPHPYLIFARALGLLAPADRPDPGVHHLAFIGRDVTLNDEVSIGALAFVGDRSRIGRGTIVHPQVYIGSRVTIGDACVIHAHVSIREGTLIGSRVVIQNGAVIGSDGFGFAPRADGSLEKIPQISNVVIEDDVEIGANTAIDRPALGETRIASGAKIDNLVQIAHGVTIGRDTILSAQVGVAGSSHVGDHVVLAGQVGVADHVTIGHGSRATAQTGIPNSIPDRSFVSGYPSIDNRQWLKASAIFRNLPELRKTITNLQRRIEALEAQLERTGDAPGGHE